MSNARPWPWVARLPTRGETCISWYPLPPLPPLLLCPSFIPSLRPLFSVNFSTPFSFPFPPRRRVDQTRRPFATEKPARAPRLYQMTANPSSLRARKSVLQPVNVARGVLVRDGRRAWPEAAQAIVSSPRMLFRAAASRWPDGAPSWPCCRNSIADHPASHRRGQRWCRCIPPYVGWNAPSGQPGCRFVHPPRCRQTRLWPCPHHGRPDSFLSAAQPPFASSLTRLVRLSITPLGRLEVEQ
ncbi:hypothetical protein IWX91DRAFT_203982 [Phyllosticta citricarpa]